MLNVRSHVYFIVFCMMIRSFAVRPAEKWSLSIKRIRGGVARFAIRETPTFRRSVRFVLDITAL